MRKLRTSAWLWGFILILACGTSEGPDLSVTFADATAFSDPSAHDMVFLITNIPVGGFMLDQDRNGQPDAFVFPQACGAQVAAGCGYSLSGSSEPVEMGALVLDFRYEVVAQVRDASGQVLYEGTTTFHNDSATTEISISLQEST